MTPPYTRFDDSSAAQVLGLSYWRSMGLIILPQALKMVIPGIVNTFIALFKDTTLVLIIGLFDMLAVIQTALADPDWLGFALEGLTFAAFVYWMFCFGMSLYSMALERKLDTSHKRWPLEQVMADLPISRPDPASAAADPMIEMRAVHKWFGPFHVLKDINLLVSRGERIVICGPSGSGKSTMIRCINRLEEHQRG